MDSGHDFKALLREYIESLLIAVVLAVTLRVFVFSAYKIPSESMLPSLMVGDFIFAYKLPYGVEIPLVGYKWSTGQTPNRGEAIVFRHPKDKTVSYIKRVVGLPGDRVQLSKGRLLINDQVIPQEPLPDLKLGKLGGKLGTELKENKPYHYFVEKLGGAAHPIMISDTDGIPDFGPQLVPPGQVFMLGDNRSSSDDSRYWGAVPLELIEGRAVLIWMSLDWKTPGSFPSLRWKRLLKKI